MPDRAADPATVREAVGRLRDASRAVRALPPRMIVEGLAAAFRLWEEDGMWVADASRDLAAIGGSSPAMIRFGLMRAVRAHSRDALHRWRAEAVDAAACDSETATGPEVIAQVLAGNVAGLAFGAIAEALLARSAVLVKPASGDPVTAAAFQMSLRRAAPVLADAVAVLAWPGGSEDVERVAFSAVDLVIASGEDESLDAIAARATAPTVRHGPRVSFGVAGRNACDRPAWWFDAVAREAVLWEQRGCLSPRVIWVEGDVPRFARRVARAMARLEARWPAPPWAPDLAAAVTRARRTLEVGDTSAGWAGDPGGAWTVGWDDRGDLALPPPARFLRVAPLPARDEARRAVEAMEPPVQAAGLAALGHRKQLWVNELLDAGIPWITRLTGLQDPPAGWRADGRSGLAELLQA